MSRVLVKFSGKFVVDEDDMMEYIGYDPKQKRKKITVRQWLDVEPNERQYYALDNFSRSLHNSVDDLLSYNFEIKENDYEDV